MINQITDTKTGLKNTSFSPGGIAIIEGQDLRFDPRDPEQGIFIYDVNERKHRVFYYGEISQNRASFAIPKLALIEKSEVLHLLLKTRDKNSNDIVEKHFWHFPGVVN